jgi:hypothetical protein
MCGVEKFSLVDTKNGEFAMSPRLSGWRAPIGQRELSPKPVVEGEHSKASSHVDLAAAVSAAVSAAHGVRW